MPRLALSLLLAAAALPASAPAVLAQDAGYVDDRSGPAAVVRSLYNAINRREYARAWSYFAVPPAADLETYARGYEDTQNVELITGYAREEGAAGSVYYQLPVAIRATASDGSDAVFAGCYTLRMTNPSIETDAFQPLGIERGALGRSDAPLEQALPRRCGDGPEQPPYDALMEKAAAMFQATAAETCDARGLDGEDDAPESHEIGFRHEYDSDDQPLRTARLFRFFCYRGAYNEIHVYYLADEDGAVAPLHFAEPALDIRYEDDDHEKPVESVTVTGFSAKAGLVNSDYDPQMMTITEHSRWRGVGDASSLGVWAFRHGAFRLVRYEVDATYDGEINPETVIDYDTAP